MADLLNFTEAPNLLELAEAYRRGPTADRTGSHLSHLSICDDDPARGDLSVCGDEINGRNSLTDLSPCADEPELSLCADEPGLQSRFEDQSVCADEPMVEGPPADQSVCADEPAGDPSVCADEALAGDPSVCADENPTRDPSICADEAPSDVRLKTDIEQVGTTVYGLPLYHFRYKTGTERFEGVMAQDVLEVMPDAVVVGEDGYYRVKYGQLGIKMTRA